MIGNSNVRMGWLGALALGAGLVFSGCSDGGQANDPVGNITPASQASADQKLGTLLRMAQKKATGAASVKAAMPSKLVNLRKDNKTGAAVVSTLIRAETAALPKLKQLGVTVRTVTSSGIMSADVPLAKLNAEDYDLVVTDLKMPNVSGLELLQALRHRDSQTPVIMMTAYGDVDTAVESMRLGAYDFIQKPFKLSDMRRQVAAALRATMTPAAAPADAKANAR